MCVLTLGRDMNFTSTKAPPCAHLFNQDVSRGEYFHVVTFEMSRSDKS